jgi:hypothetical protein
MVVLAPLSPLEDMQNIFRELRNFDRSRQGFSGEHYWVAAVGLTLCALARRSRSSAGRALALVAGTALLYRAASGRDGLAHLARKQVSAARAISRPENVRRIENSTVPSGGSPTASAVLTDSPNEAERMQQSGELGVGAGIGVEVVEGDPDDPAAKAGQEKIVPGLPDFMRGG